MRRSFRKLCALAVAGATQLAPVAARAESELEAIRAQNELLRAALEKHDDEIQALKDQNTWLRETVEQRASAAPTTSGSASTGRLPGVSAATFANDWRIDGHFLLRHYYYDFDNDSRGVRGHTNSPIQYRALLKVSKDVQSGLGATVEFGTASGNGRGLESTFGGGNDFATDPVFINQAYINWKPEVSDARLQLSLVAGKTPNPFTWNSVTGKGLMASDLVYWDGTLKQDGAYLQGKYELDEGTMLHGVASAFVIDSNAIAKDPRLFAGQAAVTHQLMPEMQLGFRTSLYEWRSLDADFINRTSMGGNLFSAFGRDEATRIVELGSYAMWNGSQNWPIKLYASVSRNL